MLEQSVTEELISKAQNGSEEAKAELIAENSPLIKSVIRRFKNKGVDYDDLYQLGCMGFLKAIRNFSASFGVKFSTYAVPMIAGEVKRFLRDDGSVKVSRSMKKTAREMNQFIEEFNARNARQPTVKELAAAFSLDESEVGEFLQIMKKFFA